MDELTEIELGDEEYVAEPDESAPVADGETGEPAPEPVAAETNPDTQLPTAEGAAERDALTQDVHEIVRLLSEGQGSAQEEEQEPAQAEALTVTVDSEQWGYLQDELSILSTCSILGLLLSALAVGVLLSRMFLDGWRR